MRGIGERIRLLAFAAVYLLCAAIFVYYSMEFSNVASRYTKLQMALILTVRFGLASYLVITAVNRIRTAFRKHLPKDNADDEGQDNDE